jgi:RNA polymerase sigma factor FliA
MILSLYYIEDLTLKEIKHILDISEARISQIHTTALKKLRESIARAPKRKV